MATISETISLIDNMSRQVDGITASMSKMRKQIDDVDGMTPEVRMPDMDGTGAGVERLIGKFKKLTTVLLGLKTAAEIVQKTIEVSDEIASVDARLNLIVDDGGSLAQLKADVMEAAQGARASYTDVANLVTRLANNAGAAFNHNNEEIIEFASLIQKQFVIGGASASEAAAAITQLSQGLAAGALRGDELNSVLEQAPGIARAIEKYMGWAEGSIKEYAQEGKVTADVIKNAMFASADEINTKFGEMPMTFGQRATEMQNAALTAFSPLLNAVNGLANNEAVWTFAQNVVSALGMVSNVIAGLINLFNLASERVLAWWRSSDQTATAMRGAFSVMAAGISNAILSMATFVANRLIDLHNAFADLANFVGNVFTKPVASVKILFLNMLTFVQEKIAAVLNAMSGLAGMVPGLSGVSNTLSGWSSGFQQSADLTESLAEGVKADSGYTEYVEKKESVTSDQLAAAAKSLVAGAASAATAAAAGTSSSGTAYTGTADAAADTAKATEATADNTSEIKNSMASASRELSYLVKIAERQAITAITTPTINIQMNNSNNISSDMDLDGVMRGMVTSLRDAFANLPEGVHVGV